MLLIIKSYIDNKYLYPVEYTGNKYPATIIIPGVQMNFLGHILCNMYVYVCIYGIRWIMSDNLLVCNVINPIIRRWYKSTRRRRLCSGRLCINLIGLHLELPYRKLIFYHGVLFSWILFFSPRFLSFFHKRRAILTSIIRNHVKRTRVSRWLDT